MEKKLAVIVDNNDEITTKNDSTKMCSSGADVVVEMCSPESDDTCGDCVPLEQPKTRYESQDRCGSGRLLPYQGF